MSNQVFVDHEHSMKALLSVAITEAVKLALIDSCVAPPRNLEDMDRCDARKAELLWDIYKITPEELGSMDPGALAQNVCCRLLGTGGWVVGRVYAGNATPREILDASLCRPDQDPLGDIKMDLGLGEETT